MSEKNYIQVILPLRLEWEPWYISPTELPAGRRVRVNFSGKEYVGVVHRSGQRPEIDESKVLYINGVAEGLPDIGPRELEFWEFIASYYLCTIGEVYREAYPSGRTRSEEIHLKETERIRCRISRLEETIEARAGSKRAKPELTMEMRDELETLKARLALMENRCIPDPARPVTKSGKPVLLKGFMRTERYLEAIRKTRGDTLILVPTNSTGDALAAELGLDGLIRFDSRQTAHQRMLAAGMLEQPDGRKVILGTRTALFLPFRSLSLIIVDEEQDSFYKQEETAPRYNGRDCAVKLAQIHGADIILGSSLPSLDSLYNSMAGKFILEDIGNDGSSLPAVEIIDVSSEQKKHGMVGAFSIKLIETARNWEGPVTLIRGWENGDDLRKHAETLFPGKEISVLRYQDAREQDMSGCLVAVMQADAMVRKDDFRADERAMQLVCVLAASSGKLVIQTAVPRRFDGSRTTADLLEERHRFGFPPYTRLVETRIKGSPEPFRRYFLKRDSNLPAEKEKIRKNTGPGMIIDVDPQ